MVGRGPAGAVEDGAFALRGDCRVSRTPLPGNPEIHPDRTVFKDQFETDSQSMKKRALAFREDCRVPRTPQTLKPETPSTLLR